jgi:hypothetical protein
VDDKSGTPFEPLSPEEEWLGWCRPDSIAAAFALREELEAFLCQIGAEIDTVTHWSCGKLHRCSLAMLLKIRKIFGPASTSNVTKFTRKEASR